MSQAAAASRPAGDDIVADVALRGTPYVGPRPFERKDAPVFFGRETETSQLLSYVVGHRSFLLYSQSGAGKSSLINAGLVPRLEQERLLVLPTVRVRPSTTDLSALNRAANAYVFNALWCLSPAGTDPATLVDATLADFLCAGGGAAPAPAAPAAAARTADGDGDGDGDDDGPPPRVLIIDQFEELFTTLPHRWPHRRGFLEQVAAALERDPMLRVLFAMREEYVASLDRYVGALPDRLRGRFRLERLRERAARAAVVGPLRRTGRWRFKGDGTVPGETPDVAQELVEDLLRVPVEVMPGQVETFRGEFVEPVQLQIVCENLYRVLARRPEVTVVDEEMLEHSGDVDGSLAGFYADAVERAVEKTSVTEGTLRQWIESRLITPVGTRGTVFRGTDSSAGMANPVLDVLEELRLVRREFRGGSQWYELTHDRFIAPIRKSNREWLVGQSGLEQTRLWLEERARLWAEENRSAARLLDEGELRRAKELLRAPAAATFDISDTARALEANSRVTIQHRRARRRLVATIVTASLVAAALGFAIWARLERDRRVAVEGRFAANVARDAAERARDIESLKRQAFELYLANNRTEAAAKLAQAETYYVQAGDVPGRVDMLIGAARSLAANDPASEDAHTLFAKAQEIAGRGGEQSREYELYAMAGVASIYAAKEETARARQLFEEVLSRQREMWGAGDLRTAPTLQGLMSLVPASEPAHVRYAEDLVRLHGTQPAADGSVGPEVAALAALAKAQLQQEGGAADEANRTSERILAFAPDRKWNVDAVYAVLALAEEYLNRGSTREQITTALRLATLARDAARSLSGAQEAHARAFGIVALANSELRETPESEEKYRRALEEAKARHDAQLAGFAAIELATALAARQEYVPAEQVLSEAVALLEKAVPPDPIRLADLLERLARVRSQRNDQRGALEAAMRGLNVLSRDRQEGLAMAEAYERYAKLFRRLERSEEAAHAEGRAQRIRKTAAVGSAVPRSKM